MEQIKSFDTSRMAKQEFFRKLPVQNFFSKWCEINDSVHPSYIGRRQWEKRRAQNKEILEKNEKNESTLFIPTDLHLWEMVEVIEEVDRNTFIDKPELRNLKKQEILTLGKMFRNSAVYIAQRIDSIKEGKSIAQKLVKDFFSYGNALITGEIRNKDSRTKIENIAKGNLSEEETTEVDQWLAGEELFEERLKKIEQEAPKDPEMISKAMEDMRKQTLAQFFGVSEEAFRLQMARKGKSMENKNHLAPWKSDTSSHSAFLKKIEHQLRKTTEAPARELVESVFSRGFEKLVAEMKETKEMQRAGSAVLYDRKIYFRSLSENNIDSQNEPKKITDVLGIEYLKKALDVIRESGDIAEISNKERKIADKIQNVVAKLPYQSGANNPAEIIKNKFINCVGASTLGGILMREAGLNYLVGHVPEHAILFLITSDGHVEWRDMLDSSFNEDLTDEMIDGYKKDGVPLTIEDIIAFSKKPKHEGLIFDIKGKEYRDKLRWVKEGERQFVAMFEPEYGQRITILNNLGSALLKLGRNEEAIEAYHQAIAVGPKHSYPYNGLGNALQNLGRNEEAIETYRQAIAIDSTYANPYNGLGNALYDFGHNEEAVEAYHQAIVIDPKYRYSYNGLGNALHNLKRNEEAIEAYRQAIAIDLKYVEPYNGLGNVFHSLGRDEEAIEMYKKFINLADSKEDASRIKKAGELIAKSQKK
jgi:tetratricopeptide (TPR) repeat protein